VPIIAAALWLSPASAEVEALVRTYISIRVFSAPAAIAIYGITGWLIAQERTGAVLALQLVQNGLNIVLSVVWCWASIWVSPAWPGPRSSRNGRGWRWACGCAAAFGVPAWRDWARVFDGAKLWRMAAVNVDILIRSLLLMAGFTSFLFFAADFGDVTLAANQVLIQFVYITAYAMDGFAFAAEALVGQAMGARAAARLRRAAVLTSVWGMVVCAAMSLVFLVAGACSST
jgi:MATE family multidrug resistance protein